MLNRLILVPAILSLCSAATAAAQSAPQSEERPIVAGTVHNIHSAILGEDRPYRVRLPDSYDSERIAPQRYPVLYLIDGQSQFLPAVGVIDHMSTAFLNLQTPEMIIVGIDTSSPRGGDSPSLDRTKDLTPTNALTDVQGKAAPDQKTSGGGPDFLEFIQRELIPYIDETYRTSDVRLLAGHSYGGLFTLYSFVADPSAFACYVAIDPSLYWDDGVMIDRLEALLEDRGRSVDARVFVSMAGMNTTGVLDYSNMLLTTMRFAEVLSKNGAPGLETKFRTFPDEVHSSVPLLSLYYGMLHCYDGLKPPIDDMIARGAEAVSEHFSAYEERSGSSFPPPESYVNQLAWILAMQFSEPDMAEELFLLNIENYPASSYARSNLGDFYAATEQPRKARDQYDAALKIDPSNSAARGGLAKQ